MIDPASLSHLPRISPEIFKYRFGLHMVKDNWPPFLYLPRILPEILKFRFSLHMVRNDWSPLSLSPAQNFPRNFKV